MELPPAELAELYFASLERSVEDEREDYGEGFMRQLGARVRRPATTWDRAAAPREMEAAQEAEQAEEAEAEAEDSEDEYVQESDAEVGESDEESEELDPSDPNSWEASIRRRERRLAARAGD